MNKKKEQEQPEYNYNNLKHYAESIARRTLNLTTHTADGIMYFSDSKRVYPNFAVLVDADIQKLIDRERQRLKNGH